MKTSTNSGADPVQTTGARYANILLDYWFKRTFGRKMSKRLMILLLMEIIPGLDIQDIEYSNKEHPNPFPGEHDVVFDIECKSSDGTRFIVEMQLAGQHFLMERALFYSTFSIQEQLLKGEKEYSFMPVYFIALMNFIIYPENPGKFFYKYSLREESSGDLMTDRVQYYFLELPKIKSITESSTNLEKFCFAMHNMTKLKSRPKEMRAELFELLFNFADISSFTPMEKVKYEHDMTTERDRRNQIAFSHDQGVKEGMEKGMERTLAQLRSLGVDERLLSEAKKMLQPAGSTGHINEILG